MLKTIEDVPGITVGHADNPVGLTGCTVVLAKDGAVCGVDVRGSAPGTRETDLLNPLNLVDKVNAVCLAGGSAYGLDAATGVMRFLEEQGKGLDVGVGVVPIVPAAVLFDLAVGDAKARPTADMGYRAAEAAYLGNQASTKQTDLNSHRSTDSESSAHSIRISSMIEGNVGAGMGATVGKLAGLERAMKSGIGTYAVQFQGGLVVGAVVAVNALGNIRNHETNQTIAGARNDKNGFLPLNELLQAEQPPISPGTNTTIAVVASNARLDKAQAAKVAQMAHDGLARCINPVHTMYDGDTVFAMATGELDATVNLVGTLSAEVLSTAVVRAVQAAQSAGGLPSASELK
ncbi:P1 family peptidase [Alicyclobacillus sp. SO9]|uniref:P1 family peptidase n=1 Tax=Alicyclobacillus sp. SO9 TaxID=2665646 RepID=UPI0018E836AD|nr:P1 family peptidase [Alicyclobacillus sp. SO9]QQE79290.1 P1 family peptidase [Alicyclobacillus sp. SO9]